MFSRQKTEHIYAYHYDIKKEVKSMKKILTLMLALAIVLSISACSGLSNLKDVDIPPLPDTNAEEPADTPEPTANEEEPAEEPAESKLPNHVILNIVPHDEVYYDPQNGDTVILTFSYDTVEVYVEGRDEASQKINEYIATLDETYYTGNDYGLGEATGVNGWLEMATDNYTYAVESNSLDTMALEFSSTRSSRVLRADSSVVSFANNSYDYTGGAHGNYVDRAYNFDAESGDIITLQMLSGDYNALYDYLVDYMFNLYTEDKDEYYSMRTDAMFMGDDPKTTLGALVREGSWYFDNDGMTIFSDIYEIGPYAAGIVEFKIPYAELAGHIDDKWMRPERDGAGTLSLMAQGDIEDGSVEVIDKVVVDENGTALCIEAEGTVYDVCLSRVNYIDKFYETAQIWMCSYMNDCVLQLDAVIPEGMPNLMVSYRDADGTQHKLLLTQSGEDGGYILSDENIEPVG